MNRLLPFKQAIRFAAVPKTQFNIDREWHLVNGRDKIVGRLATQVAAILMGKHKVRYQPEKDEGDYVVIYNTRHMKFTGDKWDQKLYRWHTGYPGGLKEIKADTMRQRRPEYVIRNAVSRMLPKNLHRTSRLVRLRLFPESQVPDAILANCSTVGADDPRTETTKPSPKEIRQQLYEYFMKKRGMKIDSDPNNFPMPRALTGPAASAAATPDKSAPAKKK